MTLREHLEAIRDITDRDADGWKPERARARDVHEHAVAALRDEEQIRAALLKAFDEQDWRYVSDAISLIGCWDDPDPVAAATPPAWTPPPSAVPERFRSISAPTQGVVPNTTSSLIGGTDAVQQQGTVKPSPPSGT